MSYFTQTAIKHISSTRLKLLRRRLGKLYGVERADRLLDRMYQMIGRYGVGVGLSPSGQNIGLSQSRKSQLTLKLQVSIGIEIQFLNLSNLLLLFRNQVRP